MFTGNIELDTLRVILKNKDFNFLIKQAITIEQAARAMWYFNQNQIKF